MNKTELKKVEWEQESYNIPTSMEYYVGTEGPTIASVKHPDNLWSILNRMETIVLDDEELEEEQKNFLLHFLGKWMTEIEPYCVKLESE